jgi:hypothetical protein
MANATYVMAPNPRPGASLQSQHRPLLFSSTASTSNDNNKTSMMSLDDRLDAARSLLGISPCSVAEVAAPTFGGRAIAKPSSLQQQAGCEPTIVSSRPRSNSAGLEALAFLATQESAAAAAAATTVRPQQPRLVPLHAIGRPALLQQQQHSHNNPVITSSSDDDSEAMPPPPPRTITRRRSVSNPEGMEKYNTSFRLSLVLPASILEEELAEASAAMKAKEEEEDVEEEEEDCEEEEEEDLNQDELLRRARSRLLEDLSQGNINGEKGVLTLPHSLAKYKEVCEKE